MHESRARTDVGVRGGVLLNGLLQGEDAAKEGHIEHCNKGLHGESVWWKVVAKSS
jgi:hypothetical protein